MSLTRCVLLSLCLWIYHYYLVSASKISGSVPITAWQSYIQVQHAPVNNSVVLDTAHQYKAVLLAATDKMEPQLGISKEALRRRKLLNSEPIQTQKAWLYSAIFPGLGQAYNRQYWKVGVLYSGFVLGTILVIYHHREYIEAKREAIDLFQQNKSSISLLNYVKGHKRERDMYIYFMTLWYIINIFDAYVGGTLKTFDVSYNLEVIIKPTVVETNYDSFNVGISMNLYRKA